MAKILVIGGSCLLGRYLNQQVDCVSTWNACYQPWCSYQLDITDKRGVQRVLGRVKPTHIIILAAVGDVDWVENNYIPAKEVNLDGLRNILEVAEDYKAHILYTSSNAVFSGDDPPYGPLSEREPVSAYGRMRKVAERVVSEYSYGWCVARLFLLYGWQPRGARDNWASRLVNMLNRRETPVLVNDRFWQPTYAGHVAKVLEGLLDEKGYWHVMGADRVTLHELGQAVADTFGFDPEQVQAILSDELSPTIAPRPVDSSYDPEAENTIVLPGIERGLEAMRDEWCDYGCGVDPVYGWVTEAGCEVHDQ